MQKTLLSILAIFLIIEEWIWDGLTKVGRKLVKLLHLQSVERWLSQTSPNMALVAFSIPLIIVTPINLLAFALLVRGMVLQGILLEIVAKLLGTLLIARVFALTKPQLMTFAIFYAVYTTVTGWLRWAHKKVAETPVYIWAKQVKIETKARLAAWLSQ